MQWQYATDLGLCTHSGNYPEYEQFDPKQDCYFSGLSAEIFPVNTVSDIIQIRVGIRVMFFFFYFFTKTYVVDTHYKCLGKALLMSINNVCFRGVVKEISTIFG